jgi:hypothetical protein
MKIKVKVKMGAVEMDMSLAEVKELQKVLEDIIGPWKDITKQMDDLQSKWIPEPTDNWVPTVVWSTTESACNMEITHV